MNQIDSNKTYCSIESVSCKIGQESYQYIPYNLRSKKSFAKSTKPKKTRKLSKNNKNFNNKKQKSQLTNNKNSVEIFTQVFSNERNSVNKIYEYNQNLLNNYLATNNCNQDKTESSIFNDYEIENVNSDSENDQKQDTTNFFELNKNQDTTIGSDSEFVVLGNNHIRKLADSLSMNVMDLKGLLLEVVDHNIIDENLIDHSKESNNTINVDENSDLFSIGNKSYLNDTQSFDVLFNNFETVNSKHDASLKLNDITVDTVQDHASNNTNSNNTNKYPSYFTPELSMKLDEILKVSPISELKFIKHTKLNFTNKTNILDDQRSFNSLLNSESTSSNPLIEALKGEETENEVIESSQKLNVTRKPRRYTKKVNNNKRLSPDLFSDDSDI